MSESKRLYEELKEKLLEYCLIKEDLMVMMNENLPSDMNMLLSDEINDRTNDLVETKYDLVQLMRRHFPFMTGEDQEKFLNRLLTVTLT